MMKTSTCIAWVIAVFISFFQVCPAPPAIFTATSAPVIGGLIGATGAIVGGVAGAAMITSDDDKDKRDLATETAAMFLYRYAEMWKFCQDELATATLTVSPAGNNGARFDGVPPECMILAKDYLATKPDPKSAPIVPGPACLEYDYLRPEELLAANQALKSLDGKATPQPARRAIIWEGCHQKSPEPARTITRQGRDQKSTGSDGQATQRLWILRSFGGSGDDAVRGW